LIYNFDLFKYVNSESLIKYTVQNQSVNKLINFKWW